jgi:hypothetical protein
MLDAGTPCPFDGLIGAEAKTAWEANPDKIPGEDNGKMFNVDPSTKSTLLGGGGILLLLLALTTGL